MKTKKILISILIALALILMTNKVNAWSEVQSMYEGVTPTISGSENLQTGILSLSISGDVHDVTWSAGGTDKKGTTAAYSLKNIKSQIGGNNFKYEVTCSYCIHNSSSLKFSKIISFTDNVAPTINIYEGQRENRIWFIYKCE